MLDSRTVEDLRKVFEEALGLCEAKELAFGSSWRQDPLDILLMKAQERCSSLDLMVKNSDYSEVRNSLLKRLLDLINYTGFIYIRIKENK